MKRSSLCRVAHCILFLVFSWSMLFGAVPNATENPYPANGASGIPLQDLRLNWSHNFGTSSQTTLYHLQLWKANEVKTGFTYKFTYNGRHYYLSDETATWGNARSACASAGGYLACPYEEALQNQMLSSMLTNGISTTYIGLTDEASENTWKWENKRDVSYTNWGSNEPNDYAGGEDYVELLQDGKWNDINGSSSWRYWMEIDANLMYRGKTVNSYFDLQGKLSPSTTYYWKIWGENPEGAGTATTWSFTTNSGTSAPSSYPSLISPANDENTASASLNPTLSWGSVSGATYYKLYVYTQRSRIGTQIGTLNGHLYHKSTSTATYATAKTDCENDRGYLVQINSEAEQNFLPNDYNYWIGFTDVDTENEFVWGDYYAPALYTNWNNGEPNNSGGIEDNVTQLGPSRKWNDATGSGSERYLIEYPADVIEGKVITTTSYSFRDTNLSPNTVYRWMVVPYNQDGCPIQDVGVWSFKTIDASSSVPGMISNPSPANSATGVEINPTLSWDVPTGSPTEYYAYLGTNNSISNAGNYTSLGNLNGHQYYKSNHASTWYWASANIQATKDGGYLATLGSANEDAKLNGSDKLFFAGQDRTAANCFRYANEDPWVYTNWYSGEPNNGGSAQYTTVKNHSGTNQWDDESLAAPFKYAVEVAPNIADGSRITTNSYSPPLLRFNTTYYWTSVASNNYGMANDNQRFSFTTTDGKVKNPIPANNATEIYSMTFDWDDVGGASNYLLYLGSADGTWNLVNGAVCETSTYTYIGDWDFASTYYWKVNTVTQLESVTGDTWSFTTGQTPVYSVEITSSPSGAVINIEGKPAFNTPHTFHLNHSDSATYTISMDNYTWNLGIDSDSNIVTNIQGDKHIHFVGTFSYAANSIVYSAEPGIQISAVPGNVGSLADPPTNTGGLDSANIVVFSGTTNTDLFVSVPAGIWYVIAYFSGDWHQANIYPIEGPGEVMFTDVPFDAKADVPVIISGEDHTLPIELSSFTAIALPSGGVRINWICQSESNLNGYYLWRCDTNSIINAMKISPLIPAQNSSTEVTYSYQDSEHLDDGSYYYWLQHLDYGGDSAYHGPVMVQVATDGNDIPGIPLKTEISNLYPNPFNPSLSIIYGLKTSQEVSIDILNIRGQIVRRIPNPSTQAGYHKIIWDGKDNMGHTCSSGIFFIRMRTPNEDIFRKVIMMK